MRICFLFILSFVSSLALAQTAMEMRQQYLFQWIQTSWSEKDGNSFESFQRQVDTPVASYAVANLTILKSKFTGQFEEDSIKRLLSKQFPLKGLTSSRVGVALRFEGYSAELRRQVVIFTSLDKGFLKTSTAIYRPFYGEKISLEVELWQRLIHDLKTKNSYSWFKRAWESVSLIDEAHAQIDCSQCAGNPMCLMLCQSANSGGGAGGFNFAGLDLSGITGQLGSINTQIGLLNTNVANANVNWQNSNNNWNESNQNWETSNGNWSETNKQIEQANKNFEELNSIIDKRTGEALDLAKTQSEEWRKLMDKQSTRALDIAEKMTDPKHLFTMAAASAAGAVVGASVANLAISGVTAFVGLLGDWVTGKIGKKNGDELLTKFNTALKIYTQADEMSKKMEQAIDESLSSMRLYKRFKLENPDVLANIQKYILKTEFDIEDAKKDRCVDKLVVLNQELVEYKSLAVILNQVNPMAKMCNEMKDAFMMLAKAEGEIQNANPHIRNAEKVLNIRKAKEQNKTQHLMGKLEGDKMSRKVANVQSNHLKDLLNDDIQASNKLAADLVGDCKKSFEGISNKKIRDQIKHYCEQYIFQMDLSNKKDLDLETVFPELTPEQKSNVTKSFDKKLISRGLNAYKETVTKRQTVFNEGKLEIERHKEATRDLNDRQVFDVEVALNEIKSINMMMEKVMNHQSVLFTKDLREKELSIEELCMDVTGAKPVESKKLEELKQASATVDLLNGSKVGDTSIHCVPEMLRIECAKHLEQLKSALETTPSKLPRIVVVPSYGTNKKSVLLKSDNPGLSFLQVSSRVKADELPKIIQKQEERFLAK